MTHKSQVRLEDGVAEAVNQIVSDYKAKYGSTISMAHAANRAITLGKDALRKQLNITNEKTTTRNPRKKHQAHLQP